MVADEKAMAAAAFDAACGYCLARARERFVDEYARYFSNETDNSICHKARLVRDMLDRGVSWSDATDHPDVYLGQEDMSYVSYLLDHWKISDEPHLSLGEYRYRRLKHYAVDEVRRALSEQGA